MDRALPGPGGYRDEDDHSSSRGVTGKLDCPNGGGRGSHWVLWWASWGERDFGRVHGEAGGQDRRADGGGREGKGTLWIGAAEVTGHRGVSSMVPVDNTTPDAAKAEKIPDTNIELEAGEVRSLGSQAKELDF